jgi:hypothetical protein
MPRPVLSETTFNSDNVATSILQQANLQITNENLGVTDKSSIFTLQTGFSETNLKAFAFNGFMFLQFFASSNPVPANATKIYQISDSDFYPNDTYYTHTISYQGDGSEYVGMRSDGSIKIHYGTNSGQTTWYCVVDTFYRFD